jgi:hypothetical protein
MDFKFITLFKIAFFILAIFSFFVPWTLKFSESGDIYRNGFDYVMGCDPIDKPTHSHYVQTPYLILFPIILFVSLILSLYENKKYVVFSVYLSFFSIIWIVIWFFDMSYLFNTHWLHPTWGIIFALISIIAFIVVGFMTLAFCDLDIEERPEQKADQAKTN